MGEEAGQVVRGYNSRGDGNFGGEVKVLSHEGLMVDGEAS